MPNTDQLKPGGPKSNKTTIGGVVAFVGLLLTALSPLFDGDPETAIETEQITLIVASFGALWAGWMGRDNDVSSEGNKLA